MLELSDGGDFEANEIKILSLTGTLWVSEK
jgi:hypothetical protein